MQNLVPMLAKRVFKNAIKMVDGALFFGEFWVVRASVFVLPWSLTVFVAFSTQHENVFTKVQLKPIITTYLSINFCEKYVKDKLYYSLSIHGTDILL